MNTILIIELLLILAATVFVLCNCNNVSKERKSTKVNRRRFPNVSFHGGCLGCKSQELYGKKRCTGCQYFEANWNLPDLSTCNNEREEELAKIREEFKK